MLQQNVSFLSSRRTIQFWHLLTQSFIKVHANSTALTWNTGLCIFNFPFCMDFAKFMSFVHKLRPSSCLILNQKFLLVDPCSSFRSRKLCTTPDTLDFQNEGPSYLFFKFQKSLCRIFLHSKQNWVAIYYLPGSMFCRLSNRFECTCKPF